MSHGSVNSVFTTFAAAERPDLARFLYMIHWAPAGETSFLDLAGFNRRWLEQVDAVARHLVKHRLVAEGEREIAALAIAGVVNLCLMRHIKEGLPLGESLARNAARFLVPAGTGRSKP